MKFYTPLDIGMNSRVEKGEVVRDAGGVGMILANVATNDEDLVANSHLLLAVAVGCKAGDLIKKYVRSDRNPTAFVDFWWDHVKCAAFAHGRSV